LGNKVGRSADKTKRITIGLPEAINEGLEEWAIEEGRPVASLAAHQLEQAIRIKFPDRFPPQIQRVDVARPTPD
jgi:hypothetical protein